MTPPGRPTAVGAGRLRGAGRVRRARSAPMMKRDDDRPGPAPRSRAGRRSVHSRSYRPNAAEGDTSSVTGHDPQHRPGEQLVVAGRDAFSNRSWKREEVRECDQDPVDEQLGQRMAVDREGRGTKPPAHVGAILVAPPASAGRSPGRAGDPGSKPRHLSPGARRACGRAPPGRGGPAARGRPRRGCRARSPRLASSRRRRPSAISACVDRAEAALERRPDRRAQGDRLAVHRPAGADHEVGVGDQRLGVDRLLGDDEAARPRAARPAARRSAGSTTACVAPQPLEHPGEQVVLEAVVERDRRRRAHDDDRLRRGRARARRAPRRSARSRPGSTPP